MMSAVEERLERLEKSMKRWRGATVALVGVMAVVLVAGAADTNPTAPSDLKVKSLSVVDEKGRTTIYLGKAPTKDAFTGLVIHTIEGKMNFDAPEASFGIGVSGLGPDRSPELTMLHNGKPGNMVHIAATKSGGWSNYTSEPKPGATSYVRLETNVDGKPLVLLSK